MLTRWIGWMDWREVDGDLPVVFQCRHFPNHALGAGGHVGVVFDFADGFPAVVDVGGAVDEEKFVNYLCSE
jgi:hypothetical protein